VKRLLVLFLLAVLPLQISSAAAAFHCPQGGDNGVGAAAGSAALHADHAHEHDSDDNDDGHAIGGDLDCGVLQLAALEALFERAQTFARAHAIAPAVACPGYKSHIPDGLERPKWGLAV
jgi:hypothetical protein